MPSSHDQNFKNLILDYPRQALELFAPEEHAALGPGFRIVPIRQEQLKERLGERFRELDVPLLVEWPDGRREALLFVLEEESNPSRFSIGRLAHYCLDLAELFDTVRVVPVVIFLTKAGATPERLRLGSEQHVYLDFRYIKCELGALPYELWQDSDNLVARLNLPNMRWPKALKVEIYAKAIQGLLSLEPDWNKRRKYLDFVDIYSDLTDNERQRYEQEYQEESDEMAGFAERFTTMGLEKGLEKGREEGREEGRRQEAISMLTRFLVKRFGPLDEATTQRVNQASVEQIEAWSDRVLDANSLEEVLEQA